MKTLPLRELLRRPASVKKLTASGQDVQITDNGKPLWLVRAVRAKTADPAGDKFVDEELDALLSERRSAVSASKLTLDSRAL